MDGGTVDFTKAFDSITHKSFWDALKSCNTDHDCISLLKQIYRDQKASVQTDEESNIFEIRKGTKQGDPLSSLLFNTVLQYSLKDEIQRWQKKKGMGFYLSDHDHDSFINLRFADDVMLFATSEEQTRKMLCEFKKVTEKVGLRIHPDKTKILSNQSTINSDTKKQLEVDVKKIEKLTRNESVKYLGQEISLYQQETTEIKSRIRAAWPQIQTRVDIEKLHAQTPSSATRRHSISDCLLRSGNMGTQQRTRNDATQDATTHHPNKKEIQKD